MFQAISKLFGAKTAPKQTQLTAAMFPPGHSTVMPKHDAKRRKLESGKRIKPVIHSNPMIAELVVAEPVAVVEPVVVEPIAVEPVAVEPVAAVEPIAAESGTQDEPEVVTVKVEPPVLVDLTIPEPVEFTQGSKWVNDFCNRFGLANANDYPGQQVLYLAYIGSYNGADLFKFGESSNLRQRYAQHKSKTSGFIDFLLLKAVPTENSVVAESALKKATAQFIHPSLAQKEIYRLQSNEDLMFVMLAMHSAAEVRITGLKRGCEPGLSCSEPDRLYPDDHENFAAYARGQSWYSPGASTTRSALKQRFNEYMRLSGRDYRVSAQDTRFCKRFEELRFYTTTCPSTRSSRTFGGATIWYL